MSKRMFTALTALVLIACGLTGITLLHDRQRDVGEARRDSSAETIETLRRQIQLAEKERHQAVRERDLVRQEAQMYLDRLAALENQRRADQEVVQELWDLVTEKRGFAGKQAQAQVDPNVPPGGSNAHVSERPEQTSGHDFDTVGEIVRSTGGDLDGVIQQMVTAEGIDRMLQEYGDQPAYWAAAAKLADDPQTALAYLEEAVRLHPESPEILSALVQAQITAGAVDESTLAYVRELERLDPTNALGDCYAAHCLFAEGDVPGALQALSQASAKGRFADGHIEAMMSQYDYLLNEGIPDVTSLGLSFFSPPDDHWITIKQMERQSLAQADALLAAGQYDEALQIAQDVTNLGGAISSSGRFFLNDVMGISMQKAGLTEQRLIYEAQANMPQVQEVDERLVAIDDRMSQMRTMGQAFEGAMESMTDDDLATFVDGVIVNGEFEAMQTVPEVDEALQVARETTEMEPQTDDSVVVSGQ